MNYKIVIAENSSKKIKKISLELSQVLAMVNIEIDFPFVVSSASETDTNIFIEEGEFSVNKKDDDYYVRVQEADREEFLQILKKVFDFNETEKEIIKTNEMSRDDQGRPQSWFCSLAVDSWDFETVCATSCFIARHAMDFESVVYPIFTDKPNVFLKKGENRITVDLGDVYITYKDVESFSEFIQFGGLFELEEYLNDSINCKNHNGQVSLACQDPDNTYYIEPTCFDEKYFARDRYGVKIHSYKDPVSLEEGEWFFEWEGDILKRFFKNEVSKLRPGYRVVCAIDESYEKRQGLKKEFKEILKEQGLDNEVEIYDSFKEGFSWISEALIPELKGKDLESIKIYYTPFSVDKKGIWEDLPGAVPSYSNLKNADPDRWLDLPIRLLQELYPIDDILERDLGISRDKVSFELWEEEGFTYKVLAKETSGDITPYFHRPVFSEREYIQGFESTGQVHPGTGYIKVLKGNELISFHTFKTDQERIWDYYQSEILPKTLDLTLKSLGKNKGITEPLFCKLKININLSGSDYSLGIREDRISSLDAFHEDLYFAGLDYFKLAGEKISGSPINSPGLILPTISFDGSNPRVEWEILVEKSDRPFYEDESGQRFDLKIENNNLRLKEVRDCCLYYTSNINPSKALVDLIESGFSDVPNVKGFDKISINNISIDLPKKSIVQSIDEYQPKDEIYNYRSYDEDVRKLMEVENVEVRMESRSYLGKRIHSIKLKRKSGAFTTALKDTLVRPTIFINARHHANEVSSTNSSFQLIKALASSEVLDKVNIVLVPMANPDGAQIHYLLQKDHPEWIFHVARFNALGYEFSHDYFNKETIHTEAKVFPKVFIRNLPDIYVDDHGVPSHEWVQQFSGYSPPAYRGFWLPRSVLYGYFWYPEGEEWKGNLDYAEDIQDAIAEALKEDEDLNKDLQNRFEKYAHGLMPNTFPADYYRDLIFYWIGFEYDKSHRYLSVAFPEVTVVGFTSEVIDETATGEHLDRCIQAHLKQNLAIIEEVASRDVIFERTFFEENDKIRIRNRRKRI